MIKDITIISSIIVAVVIGHIFVQNILKKDSEEIIERLQEIRTGIEQNNIDNLEEKATSTYNTWTEKANYWSILADHQEIDNIEKTILNVKSAIEKKDYITAISKIDESDFLILQIIDKEKLILKNIF